MAFKPLISIYFTSMNCFSLSLSLSNQGIYKGLPKNKSIKIKIFHWKKKKSLRSDPLVWMVLQWKFQCSVFVVFSLCSRCSLESLLKLILKLARKNRPTKWCPGTEKITSATHCLSCKVAGAEGAGVNRTWHGTNCAARSTCTDQQPNSWTVKRNLTSPKEPTHRTTLIYFLKCGLYLNREVIKTWGKGEGERLQ